MDDRLPFYDYGEGGSGEQAHGVNSAGEGVMPYNTKPSEAGAWWMPILEKGYAKYIQNYFQLNGGKESMALRGLTGMPVKRYETASMSVEDIWEKISEADAKHYIMTAGCFLTEHN